MLTQFFLPAIIAPTRLLSMRCVGQFVAGDGRQQLEQVRRGIQLVLPQVRPNKKRGQHRLANIGRIEDTPQPRIAQVNPHHAANRGLISAHHSVAALLPRRRLDG